MTAVPHPFLHVEEARIYHPLTGLFLSSGDDGYEALRALALGAGDRDARLDPATRGRLLADRWLVPAGRDVAHEFRLRFVSLEAHTLCNDACYFCPVSAAPRPGYFMPDALFARIVAELAGHGGTIESVFLNNYNEPTLDKRFVSQLAALRRAGLPPSLLTNGSGLNPERADALVDLGGLRYLSVNLSSLDAEEYAQTRGSRHLAAVLRNLDYVADRPIAPLMEIVVLGEHDERHVRAFEAIRLRFAGTRFEVKRHDIMDRAGYFSFGQRLEKPRRRLRGCENLGSRPLEHVHVTAHGHCVLCCEDYDERYVVGDLRTQSLDEILSGPQIAHLRRQAYGLEDSPDDFICRHCVFARGE